MPNNLLLPLGLSAVAFVAAMVDAIAGGGGLLTVPALLAVNPDPRLALGTNKAQSVFGAFSAFITFLRAGRVDRARLLPVFVSALMGSLLGVQLVLVLRPDRLRPLVLALLVFVALFFAARGRRKGPLPARPLAFAAQRPVLAAVGIGLSMGVYDGFFGPGTGMFLIALFVAVFGDDLSMATANAKVSNFASNLGSVLVYALAGRIDYRLALPMAAAQALGAALGARMAIRGGERVVRAGVVLISAALVARLAWQMVG